MRGRTFITASGVGFFALAAAIGAYVTLQSTTTSGPACRVTAEGHTYGLDREQAANAATIAVAANALVLPHHAVTIALAAALQESQLHNLASGDRDSLGIFQQRPSQGWGTPDQILNPRFAADAFLRALSQVDGWQTISVNEAAQRVQRSATPIAYSKWENEARALARATTGELPGALTCRS